MAVPVRVGVVLVDWLAVTVGATEDGSSWLELTLLVSVMAAIALKLADPTAWVPPRRILPVYSTDVEPLAVRKVNLPPTFKNAV